MSIEANLDIELLSVDLGNFRLGDSPDTRSAYRAMIENQKATKLSKLGADILEHGLSPAERLIVVPDEDEPGHYIVCEGNRRLTAIKLMADPRLAMDTPEHRRFVELSKDFQKNPIRSLPCVVFPDKDAAFIWIERKHRAFDGRGLVQWDSDATARADHYRGRVRPSKAVMDFLRGRSDLPAHIEKAAKGKATNLDRVLQMPYLRNVLGVRVEKDGTVGFDNNDEVKGAALLRAMLERITGDGFTVNDIRSAALRERLIDEFSEQSCSAPPGRDASTSKPAQAATQKKSRVRVVRDQSARPVLALVGSNYALKITEKKLAELYREARHINVDALTNASAVLCRVFLELATDHFLEATKVPLPATGPKQQPWTSWSDKGLQLKAKIEAALHALDPSGKSRELLEARKGVTVKESVHYIHGLHDFVHNLHSVAHPRDVKTIWEKWHPYLSKLFEAVDKALSKPPPP